MNSSLKLFAPLFLLCGLLSAAADGFPFQKQESSAGIVTPAGKSGGRIRLRASAVTASALTGKTTVHAQHNLRFVIRGGGTACDVRVVPELILAEGKESRTVRAAPVLLTGTDHKTVTLEVGQDFGLGDAFYQVREIRFAVSGKAGSVLWITGIRMGDRDVISATGTGMRVYSAYRRPAPRSIPGLKPLRVYFELDNNDLDPHIRRWRAQEMAPDPNPSGGFRALLLQNADGIAELAESPEHADVIVYSCARGKDVSRLVPQIRRGVRTVIYGPVVNKEMDALAPLALTERKISGSASRSRVRLANAHPMFGDGALLNSDYGRYHDVRLRHGHVLLNYEDGQPLAAVSGNVVQFATGLGTLLQPAGDVFYDPLFLRTVCAGSEKALKALKERERAILAQREERRRSRVAEILGGNAETGWRLGMSGENFGRFGWLISEGLLCGSIGRDLTVSNGAQYYRFEGSEDNRISLPAWRHRVLDGNVRFSRSTPENTDPTEVWSGLGTVEYSTEFRLPSSWRGKQVLFEVDGGIDDVDEAFVNGVRIGKTGSDVPEYWRTRRAYPIPENLLRHDGMNRLTVNVTNLRDNSGFNSRPYIRRTEEKRETGKVIVESVSWTGKRYRVEDGASSCELEFSLLSPFILYRFRQNSIRLALEDKTAQYAAVPLKNGVRIVDLRKNGDVYSRSADGGLTEPWILLFRKNWEKACPVLVVFSRNPEKLSSIRNGEFVSGLVIDGGARALDHIAAGWPFGAVPVDASGWDGGLPEPVAARLRNSLKFALNYPVGVDEIFRVDRAGKRVEIVNRFRFKAVEDEWRTPKKPYAFLPPLAGFMLKHDRYVCSPEKLTDFRCNTDYGPLLGKNGTAVIRYSLPLPDGADFIPVDVNADPELHETIDSFVGNGLRWSRGGRVPCEEFTFAWPEGEKKHPESITLSFYTWNYGFSTAYQGAFFLSEQVRKKLADCLRRRYEMPLELYQYKSVLMHREEPFSGLRYPILFDHNHENSTNYAPGIGSRVIYGDANEGCTMLAWIGDVQANLFGRTGVVKNAWNFIRYGMRYETVLDDYAFHASTCREFGGGAFVDMLNGEYAAFVSYARLAALNGDRAQEEEGLYRAAKRGIPTLARLFFLDYIAENMPQVDLQGAVLVTGFSEDRQNVFKLPSKSHNFVNANELFDLAQGFPGTLYRLYETYAPDEVRDYVNRHALPNLRKDDIMRPGYFPPMMLYAAPEFPVDEQFRRVLGRSGGMKNDWPGMRMSYQLGLKLWREYGMVGIADFERLSFENAVYDPGSNSLELLLSAAPDGRLAISSAAPVVSVVRNGGASEFFRDGAVTRLPLAPGRNRIKVQFEKQRKPLFLQSVNRMPKEEKKRKPSGTVIFTEQFFGPLSSGYRHQPDGAKLVSAENGNALEVTGGLVVRRIAVPENETVSFSARIMAENVVRKNPKQHWTGTRFSVYMGKNGWKGVRAEQGSFGWKTVSFKVDVPAGVRSVQLQMGLKDASGTVRFQDVRAEVVK